MPRLALKCYVAEEKFSVKFPRKVFFHLFARLLYFGEVFVLYCTDKKARTLWLVYIYDVFTLF